MHKKYLGIDFQKCVMIFRIIDYTKNVLRINCRGIAQNSLRHQLHTSICCVFWAVCRLQIRIDLLRNLGSKDAHGKLGEGHDGG